MFSNNAELREQYLLKVIAILARTAKYQSSDHFLTYRYWVKALTALSDKSFCVHFPVFVRYHRWLVETYLRNPKHLSDVDRELWPKRIFDFLKDYWWATYRISDMIVWIGYTPCCAASEEDQVKQEEALKMHQELLDPLLVILSALPDPVYLVTHAIPFCIQHFWGGSAINDGMTAKNESDNQTQTQSTKHKAQNTKHKHEIHKQQNTNMASICRNER